MHIQYTIDITISGTLLAGIAAGAAIATIYVAYMSARMALVESLLSLGGGYRFLEFFLGVGILYIPAGAIIGGITGAFGLAWPYAALDVVLVIALVAFISNISHRRSR